MDYWAHKHVDEPELRKQVEKSDWEKELAAAEAEAVKAAADRLSHALGRDVEATPDAVLRAAKGGAEGDAQEPAMDEGGMRFGAPKKKPAAAAAMGNGGDLSAMADDFDEVFSFKAP